MREKSAYARRLLIRFGVLLVLFAFCMCAVSSTAMAKSRKKSRKGKTAAVFALKQKPAKKRFAKSDAVFIAHAGLSSKAPANTLAAFRLAGEAGFWGVECDVWETAPRMPGNQATTRFVICHNLNTGKVYKTDMDIRKSTPQALSKLTAKKGNCISKYPDERMPFIEDFLSVCKRYHMHPVIEIKGKSMSSESIQRLVSIVRGYVPLHDVLFISFYHINLDYVKDAAARYGEKTSTVYLYSDFHAKIEELSNIREAADRAAANGYTAVGLPKKYMKGKHIRTISERCLETFVFTIDDYALLKPFVKKYPIKGVITNKKLFR